MDESIQKEIEDSIIEKEFNESTIQEEFDECTLKEELKEYTQKEEFEISNLKKTETINDPLDIKPSVQGNTVTSLLDELEGVLNSIGETRAATNETKCSQGNISAEEKCKQETNE